MDAWQSLRRPFRGSFFGSFAACCCLSSCKSHTKVLISCLFNPKQKLPREQARALHRLWREQLLSQNRDCLGSFLMTQMRKLKWWGCAWLYLAGAVCIPSHPTFSVYQVSLAFVSRSILDASGGHHSDLMSSCGSAGDQEPVTFMVKQWHSAVNPLGAPLLLCAGMENHFSQRIIVGCFFSSYSTPFHV